MKCIIAEKPSVANEIALIVGATSRKDGYLEGNGYFVTWAFGHLVGLALPASYGCSGFNKENLPIIPEQFIIEPRQTKGKDGYVPDAGVLKQLNIIETLFQKSESLIVATDAGREGELIFRYIYIYLNCKKPFERLWISSLTEQAIKEGMSKLCDGRKFDNLFYAAKARSEADWLVGINSSQALTISAGKGVFSLGRVQSPTLAMICRRFLENKNFTPTPFWDIKIHSEKNNIPFTVISDSRISDKNLANNTYEELNKKDSPLSVISVVRKEVTQEPPLLYDLTALQKDANRYFSFSAEQTLNIAQKLYEKKYITYPRTGSNYISEDVFATIPKLIKSVFNNNEFGQYAQALNTFNQRSVNNAKVTDHHALLITGVPATNLTEPEKEIYNLIIGRMLEAFSNKCVKDATNIKLSCKDILFKVNGSIIKSPGWTAVYNTQTVPDEEEAANLPELKEGEVLPINRVELLTKQTKPKPLLTEASLLALMESCGKELEDEEERQALRDAGIGTPATRAMIIETLFQRDYIKREKKNLVPTDKGLSVFDVIKNKIISDVSLTGKWENALSYIERGKLEVKRFNEEIINFTRNITTDLLKSNLEMKIENLAPCPKCKQNGVKFYPKVVKCIKCDFAIFKEMAQRKLTDSQIIKLLKHGKTPLIKGFKSKAGNDFDAFVILDENFKVIFEFKKNK